jgi:uncharacterized coiled-coil protein SlyX
MAKRTARYTRRGGTRLASAHDDIAKRLLEYRLRRPIVDLTPSEEGGEPGTSVVEPVSGLRANVPEVVDITRAELEMRIAELEGTLERVSTLIAELRERIQGLDAAADALIASIEEVLTAAPLGHEPT